MSRSSAIALAIVLAGVGALAGAVAGYLLNTGQPLYARIVLGAIPGLCVGLIARAGRKAPRGEQVR